ncbi:MAG: sirohydrochlorin cobaltochelatase [Lachnospiraceae bacterium]|nr:sirohydrochlorin cobaltochelatase [Lachnospiraceae bacterium]
MKNKFLTMPLALVMALALTACGNNASAVQENPQTTEDTKEVSEETVAEETKDDESVSSDPVKEVSDLIDAIYVQQRTDETDELCAKAKEAWDALTEEQKQLVSGENADYDYFGRDTGDASLDDPLNADDIGEIEILVVSFGTSFNDSRTNDIGGIEKAIQKAFPTLSVRRAFTSQIIINHVQARDGIKIDNVDQALERAVNNKVKTLIVQPTHLMHGAEYDELTEILGKYADKFEQVIVSEPLLGEHADDEKAVNKDKEIVAKSVLDAAIEDAGFESIDKSIEESTAFVFLGHGTSHKAKVTYSQMVNTFKDLGYPNAFVGTVEGEPEETSIDEVISAVADAGFKNVILRPLMVVAGDHANNDMAGDDEDSWKSIFESKGVFNSVECQIEGLGSIEELQNLYVSHINDALEKDPIVIEDKSDNKTALEDGIYSAKFETDSGMFKINETKEGRGILTVKDGKMTMEIVLSGDGIVGLYEGLAKDAKNDEKNRINCSKVTVKYDDGSEEEVNSFVIDVPVLDKEFDLALIGKKEKWYDHKVIVSDVKPVE